MDRKTRLKKGPIRHSAIHFVFFSAFLLASAAFGDDLSWQSLGRFIQMSVIELPDSLLPPRVDSIRPNSLLDRHDCTDLFSVTCMPGEFDDGTAVMHTPTLDEATGISYLKKIFDRAKKDLQVAAVWDPIIQKKENRSFVEKVIDFAHLSNDPYCSQGDIQSKNCLSRVKYALVQVSEDLVLEQARYYYKTGEVVEEDERPPESIAFSEPYGSLVNYSRDVTKENSGLFERGHKRWLKIVPQTALPLMKKRVQDIEKRIFPELRSLVQDIVSEKVSDGMKVDSIKNRIGITDYKGDILCNSKHPLIGLLDSTIKIARGPDGDPYLRTCGLFLDRNPSEYALVFHLAKRIASVVDPCALTGKIPGTDSGSAWAIPNLGLNEQEADEEFPIGAGLLSCLRKSDSGYARGTGITLAPLPTLTPTPTPAIEKTPPPKPDQPLPERAAFHCVKSDQEHFDEDGYVRPKEEQVTEAFTDWVATESLVRWVETHRSSDLERMKSDRTKIRNGYSNVFRSFCRLGVDKPVFRETTLKFPPLDRRINGILSAHPRVREQMACPIFQGGRYCSGIRPKEWDGNPFQFDGEIETTAPKPY